MALARLGKLTGAAGLTLLLLAGLSFAAWLTHVIVAIKAITTTISTAYALLLIVGVFFPPVGVIHGIGVWLGIW
ncbi:MAG: hypothetical protein O3A88_06055 [Proteobacteria bacterium]|nr:hypothetical protein [Pseudomonadota bacterium]